MGGDDGLGEALPPPGELIQHLDKGPLVLLISNKGTNS